MPLQFPTLAEAIARFEGFGTSGTLATRNNNPGNLIPGSFSTAHGAVGESGGFAVFPDYNTGFQAEDALIKNYADKGYTIEELLRAWAPPSSAGNSEANTQKYIDFVSGKLGVPASTPISATAVPEYKPLPDTGPSFLGSVLDGIVGAPVSTLGTLFGVPWSRIGAFLLGLIIIAGAIYLFKPVQNVVNKTAVTAAKTLI